ncbi:hypothetical protein NPIL_355271 [Nephila pilipes]|uniref:Uncharacterized protein n=1 Tax=Nephila pilipes TaxID=299642 RepID=A0A8X6UHR5_NEPPI|nr:hypothetical protein NPIL_355271 [Nephila pilipes]
MGDKSPALLWTPYKPSLVIEDPLQEKESENSHIEVGWDVKRERSKLKGQPRPLTPVRREFSPKVLGWHCFSRAVHSKPDSTKEFG